MFTVSNTGAETSSSLDGYYVQVVIDSAGYYDNIVVTSTAITTIMDETLHNGSLTASTFGFWYNTSSAIPTGWVETSQYMYTTATSFAQAGTSGKATNNTGELVQVGRHYRVMADLGGATGSTTTVKVYATENSDGTGDKVLLVDVSRDGNTSDGYNLFTVSNTGEKTSSSLSGYYVQVVLDSAGYYDNIAVSSFPSND